jgi:ATP-dependent Clp protease adapter protein ClpS
MYKVLLHNDSVNDFGHVIRCVMDTFHYPFEQAFEITLSAHKTGVAMCTVEPLERAELHRDQLQAFSLTATVEPD